MKKNVFYGIKNNQYNDKIFQEEEKDENFHNPLSLSLISSNFISADSQVFLTDHLASLLSSYPLNSHENINFVRPDDAHEFDHLPEETIKLINKKSFGLAFQSISEELPAQDLIDTLQYTFQKCTEYYDLVKSCRILIKNLSRPTIDKLLVLFPTSKNFSDALDVPFDVFAKIVRESKASKRGFRFILQITPRIKPKEKDPDDEKAFQLISADLSDEKLISSLKDIVKKCKEAYGPINASRMLIENLSQETTNKLAEIFTSMEGFSNAIDILPGTFLYVVRKLNARERGFDFCVQKTRSYLQIKQDIKSIAIQPNSNLVDTLQTILKQACIDCGPAAAIELFIENLSDEFMERLKAEYLSLTTLRKVFKFRSKAFKNAIKKFEINKIYSGVFSQWLLEEAELENVSLTTQNFLKKKKKLHSKKERFLEDSQLLTPDIPEIPEPSIRKKLRQDRSSQDLLQSQGLIVESLEHSFIFPCDTYDHKLFSAQKKEGNLEANTSTKFTGSEFNKYPTQEVVYPPHDMIPSHHLITLGCSQAFTSLLEITREFVTKGCFETAFQSISAKLPRKDLIDILKYTFEKCKAGSGPVKACRMLIKNLSRPTVDRLPEMFPKMISFSNELGLSYPIYKKVSRELKAKELGFNFSRIKTKSEPSNLSCGRMKQKKSGNKTSSKLAVVEFDQPYQEQDDLREEKPIFCSQEKKIDNIEEGALAYPNSFSSINQFFGVAEVQNSWRKTPTKFIAAEFDELSEIADCFQEERDTSNFLRK